MWVMQFTIDFLYNICDDIYVYFIGNDKNYLITIRTYGKECSVFVLYATLLTEYREIRHWINY